MSYHKCQDRGQSFDLIRQAFMQAEGLPFSEILTEEQIQHAFEKEGESFGQQEDDVYTAPLTLWAFLSQVLHSGVERSCNAAVERLRSLCVALGCRAPSPDSGEYCRARAKLPENVLQDLTYQVADELEEQAPKEWLWHGHSVKQVDGSSLMTPDTEANQVEWPQSRSQKPGLGFPIMRFCALISLATGALCAFAEARFRGKETGETALLRSMMDRLQPGDVLLGDSIYCSYFMIALLRERDVHVVFHQHQRRITDFRTGERLGQEDHLAVWKKPTCPDWMDEATYDRLPAEMTVRELRVRVSIPGFRVRAVTIVTTLANAKEYCKEEVGDLYRQRWNVELDLRAAKTVMNLEDLRGKCPDMVRKEIWIHWLAYNLIRRTMATAAVTYERTPRTISFAGAKQTVSGAMTLATAADGEMLDRLADQKLYSIASRKVGHRPNRVEPRAVKRRPKKQKLLTKPRNQARAELGVPFTSAL